MLRVLYAMLNVYTNAHGFNSPNSKIMISNIHIRIWMLCIEWQKKKSDGKNWILIYWLDNVLKWRNSLSDGLWLYIVHRSVPYYLFYCVKCSFVRWKLNWIKLVLGIIILLVCEFPTNYGQWFYKCNHYHAKHV